jgi:fructose-bisphosphate aldolase class I
MDGTHTLARCEEVTRQVLAAVFEALNVHHVMMDGMLLKPNMVTPGHDSAEYKKTTPQQIAQATVRSLQFTVPPSVPGIMFLSGGQEEEEASINLDAINRFPGKKPWSLTFSYGRALQHSAIEQWHGKPENVGKGQDAFFKRAKANSEANLGKYNPQGTAAAGHSAIYEANYKY